MVERVVKHIALIGIYLGLQGHLFQIFLVPGLLDRDDKLCLVLTDWDFP